MSKSEIERALYPRRSKYRNAKTQVAGITFHSKKEARRYTELLMLESRGLIQDLECQKRYDIVVNGMKVCSYVADFCYWDTTTLGGIASLVIEDVKGYRTREYRIKAKLMRACHGITIREV